jgi:hypothetical protein
MLGACSGHTPTETQASDTICSQQWFKTIDAAVTTGDGQGHGPDIGSDEWHSVVEFKLGVRDKTETPERNTEAWCIYVDKLVGSLEAPQSEATQ